MINNSEINIRHKFHQEVDFIKIQSEKMQNR